MDKLEAGLKQIAIEGFENLLAKFLFPYRIVGYIAWETYFFHPESCDFAIQK